MLSASSGSILTAFVLTPFDVIRIRMQQQEIMPESKPCCSSHYQAAPAATATRNTLVANTSVLAPTESHLFWLDKDYCKNVKNCTRIDSTYQGFVTISRNEGLPTLWRGISLTLLMAIPANVIYFTGYEYIRDNSPISGSINSLLCGASARLMAATAVAPLELVKTRLQSIPSSRANPRMLSNVLAGALADVRTYGVRSLFKGLQITLWRDVPFSGIYWSLYEMCKKEFGSMFDANFDMGTHAENDSRVFATSFLSGSVAGSVAAVCTHPFDVGKTRLQISQDNSKDTKRSTMFKYLFNIYKNEGPRALFGGLGPRVIKVAPACAIMISSYEITKIFFKN
ncbi:Carrier protein, mitochondrial [Yamadazyma tenuis]|nr:Carrier protein, mitochondrial [Yamadazyma tenuis]